MKLTSIGADISNNDVSCSWNLISSVEQNIPQLLELGAHSAALTNITGDDLVISAFVPDDKLEEINAAIVEILRNNAEDIGDVEGISPTPEGAGEGISVPREEVSVQILYSSSSHRTDHFSFLASFPTAFSGFLYSGMSP